MSCGSARYRPTASRHPEAAPMFGRSAPATRTLCNVAEGAPPAPRPGTIGAGEHLIQRGVDIMAATDPKEPAKAQSRLEPVSAEEFDDLPVDDYPVSGSSVDIPEPIIVREWKLVR